jgi:serine/threonine-protein kinase HipA
MEYEYSLCAKKCGIEMPETRLFESKIHAGYFGAKRFDRLNVEGNYIQKVHMVSVAGLLETSHRTPNLDYHILMKLTMQLTRDYGEIEKLFRVMCFNVFAHNRDDHSKNFAYLYDNKDKCWRLSPAYDLTYSHSIGGEHATTINGEGVNPNIEDILEVARNIGMNVRKAKMIAREIEEIVAEDLG